MFRLLRLKPPNGWNAVGWELTIVTLGVIIALGAQQGVENLSWKSNARTAQAALKSEVGDHYANAVEWRMVHPCIIAQIDRLRKRVMDSGAALDPAPIYREAGFSDYVLRIPSKEFNRSTWDAAIADGVTPHLDPALRKELGQHYEQANSMTLMTDSNDRDGQRLFSLSWPLALDASARLGLVQALDEVRGRANFMDLVSGQLLDHATKADMVPAAGVTRKLVEHSGTLQFCLREHFPTRTLDEAKKPVGYFYSPKHFPGPEGP